VTGLGGEQAAELVAAITLVTGCCSPARGAPDGWIAQFLSKAVVVASSPEPVTS